MLPLWVGDAILRPMLKVATTSAASKVDPSEKVTPWRKAQVQTVRSSFGVQDSSKSRNGIRAVDYVGVESFCNLFASAQRFTIGLIGTEHADRFGVLHPYEDITATGIGNGKEFVGERAGLLDWSHQHDRL